MTCFSKAFALALGMALVVASCATEDTSWPAPDASLPDRGAQLDQLAPDAHLLLDQMQISADTPALKVDAKVTPPVPCGTSPLDLTRFPASQRTTSDKRTFTGWGGAATAGKAQKVPVIFVHGNGGDADGFKPFRQQLCAKGYSDLELWAITFQDNICSGTCSSGSNTEHASELELFVSLVRSQTQASRVIIVAVSMGVPAARYYLKFLGGTKRDEVAVAYFVSGPNHGLAVCDVGGAAMINVACAEVTSATLYYGWLYDLNNPDETPNGQGDGLPSNRTIIYRTVSYTGDSFFPGIYGSSPKLEGADNLSLPGSTHAAIDMADLLTYLNKAVP